jgi:hypothetical protein
MADTLNPDSVTDTLKSLQRAIAEGSLDQTRTLVKHQQARARRQAVIADRLAATLGQEHDRVQSLRRAGESARQIAAHFSRVISRIEAARAVRPGSLLFSGRAIDAAGRPMAGAKIRLSDRAGTLRVPGEAMTDDRGEFTLAVPPDAFDTNAPDLALVVEDAQERIAGMSSGQLLVQPDVWQRVEITAATPPQPAGEAGAGRRRRTARRRSPKPPNR